MKSELLLILSNYPSKATNNGNVTTIEKRQDMINIAKNIQTAGLNENFHFRRHAQEILPTIQEQFDLIFIDAAKDITWNFYLRAFTFFWRNDYQIMFYIKV